MWQLLLTHTPLLYFVQSLWRDEAFSIFVAQRSVTFIMTRLGFEPPVYYLMLHYWIRIFGESEIATRSLSLLGLVCATIIIIRWSEKLFKNHWLALFTPVFFFFNPMLLYYGFEVRTYGWYIFFATASLFSYANKRWKWFVATSLLGFYTHTYFLLLLMAIGAHWFLTEGTSVRRSWHHLSKNPAIRSFGAIVIGSMPWIAKIIMESSRLKNSWYFPVDLQLVSSVLGNMFIGYEGTPWYGWKYTHILSYILLGFGYLALRDKLHRKRNLLFVLCTIIPLVVSISISFIKPLFVNRYLIPVTIAEIMTIAVAVHHVRNVMTQKTLAALWMIGVIWINWWYPPLHAKLPIRDTINQINALRDKNDRILAESPLIYLETRYYATDRSKVFLYNPNKSAFPWYVGDAVVTAGDMVQEFPAYPTRAYLVHENGTYEVVYRMAVTQPRGSKN